MTFAVRSIGAARDVPFSSVLSLLHMEGANGSTTFTDSAGGVGAWTRFGNAALSTAQKPFGASSGLFDGNGDYLECAASSQLNRLLSEPFYVAGWVRPSASKDAMRIFGAGVGSPAWSGATGLQMLLQLLPASGGYKPDVQLLAASGSAAVSASATGLVVPLNAWSHIVAQFDPVTSQGVLGVNGTLESFTLWARSSVTASPKGTYATIPGEAGNSLYAFQGNMKDMRIAVGVAPLSGSSYMVPSGPYPDS